MSPLLLAGVICFGLLMLGLVAFGLISAIENVQIAKHTGRDPRKIHMTMTGTGEKTSRAVVEAGERLAADGANPRSG